MTTNRPNRWIVMEELRRLQQPGDPYRWYNGDMPGWKWLMFDGAIFHQVPDELYDVIVIDLERRGCPLREERSGKALFLDQPGMIATDRPLETIFFADLELTIPSEDVAHFAMKLGELPLRDGRYYKLHDGWRCCLVLTPDQRDELLVKLKELAPLAEARAAEFWMGRTLPSQVLREAAAKTHGLELDKVPNLGGNKLDRFKVKGGGTPN